MEAITSSIVASGISLLLAVVFLAYAVARRMHSLKSSEVHHQWGRPKASRETRELEERLLEEEEKDDEQEFYLVKSRSPLASRQCLYATLTVVHGMIGAWHAHRGSRRWPADLLLCLTWLVVYCAEGVDHAYVKLRAEPKRVSWFVAAISIVAMVAVCYEMDLSNLRNLFFLKGLNDLTPVAFWCDVAVFITGTFWRKASLKAYRSVNPPTKEELALNVHSIISFGWLTSTLLKAKDEILEINDLPPINGDETAEELWKRFQRILGPEKERPRETWTKDKEAKRRIWLQLVWLVWPQVTAFAFFAIMSVVFTYVRVFAFQQFLNLLTNQSTNAPAYWLTVGALFLCPLLTAALQSMTSMLQTRMSLRCRAVLIRLIYRKSLRVDLGATGASVGEVVNLMSADVNSIVWTAAYSDALWLPILEATACLAFIFYLVGVAGLCAFIIMGAMAIINNRAFKRIFATQRSLMVKRDERLSAISEALNNIRLVKLAGMEMDIHALVSKLRDQELTLVLRFQMAIAALISFITSGPKMAALSTFLTFTLGLGRRLSPAVGFTTLELLNNLEDSFIELPAAIDALARAATALQKLDEFLDVKEVDGLRFVLNSPKDVGATVSGSFKWSIKSKPKDDEEAETPKDDKDNKGSILKRETTSCFFCKKAKENRPPPPAPRDTEEETKEVENPLLSSGEEGEKEENPEDENVPTLREIALELPKGALVLVVGPTGGGKSSLVSALTNEIAIFQGKDQPVSTLTGNSAALVPQKAWCQHATFRQNIAAFGSDVDLKRYRRVLRACALEPDLKLLDKGDRTKIGSRGINLSGGQQARINLARCVYARPDVALLDDPLSAVDAHVAHHIFENAILKELKHSTRILVTHQVDLTISRVDYVVFIEKGRIVEHGLITDLERQNSERLAKAMASSISAKEKADKEKPKEEATDGDDETRPMVGLDDSPNVDHADLADDDEERRERGAVSFAAYATYLRAVGSKWLLLLIFTLLVSTQVSNFLQSLAMASWISSMERDQDPNSYKMWLYIIASAAFVTCFACGFALRSATQVKASRRLHSLVLKKVLGSKVSFFDVTPVGRIQNRFSSDFQSVDREL